MRGAPVPRTGARRHRYQKHRSRNQGDATFGRSFGEFCCDGPKRGAIRAAERELGRRFLGPVPG
jgi:hypothetical protein